MKNAIQSVDFHGKIIPTIQHDGKHYVGMKAICENIGLGWQGQHERIRRHVVLQEGVRVIRIPSNGGEQDMVCLPLEYLNGWLFGVDVTRLKNPGARTALIRYQRECFKVLYDYWHNGKAENPRRTTPDERAGLRQAVTMLTTKRGLMHDEAYRLIHQRFNVSHIEEIPAEQLPQAVEYVHRLALEGELLPPPEDKDAGYIRSHQVAAIGLMHVGRLRFEEQKKALLRLRDLTAQAHERLKATLAETRATLDLTNDILYGSGAIWDGLHESLFHLMLPDEVMDEGRSRAQKHYKPRILA